MNISVVIPSYNRKDFLKRSIDSAINQTKKPIEIIVVDYGSTDGTEAMIKSDYDFVKFIKQKNKGVSAARNIGIKVSIGEWICFLDSDDEWKKDKLEKQINAMKSNPGYKFFHSNEIWIKNGLRINQKKKHKKYGGDIFDKCLDICRISCIYLNICQIYHRHIFYAFSFDLSLTHFLSIFHWNERTYNPDYFS